MSVLTHVFPGALLHPTPYYGYPTVSAPRRIPATILGVIHTTESSSVPYPTNAKSWTFSVERDGTVHQFMDPVIASPWTNGDKQQWDTSNPIVVAAANSTFNFNELCFITIENVNRIFAGERLTQAQLDADRAILEWGSDLSGLPVDRNHVIGHYQVNGVTRINCPTVPSDRDRVFAGVIGGDDDMYKWVEKVKPAAYYAVFDENSALRRWPTIEDASLVRLFATSPERLVVGTVDGEEFAGSTEWVVVVVAGGIRVIHSANILSRREVAETGYTDEEVAALQAKARAEGADAVRDAARREARKQGAA